jgi:hypothetical protein
MPELDPLLGLSRMNWERFSKPVVTLICLLTVFVVPHARCQFNGYLDPTSCYSSILVDKQSWVNDENTRYRLLSHLDRDEYESLKASGTLQILFKGVPIGGSFDADKAAAMKTVQDRDEQLEKSIHRSSESMQLDPQATDIIKDCLHAKAMQGYGLFSYSLNHSPFRATLTLDWNWIDAIPIKIIRSQIHNGHMADITPERRTLYDETGFMNNIFHDHFAQSAKFELAFDDPDEDMIVTLVTDPNIRMNDIVIPHTPLRHLCKIELETADKDPALTQSFGPFKFDNRQHVVGQQEGMDYWRVDQNVPWLLTEVTCLKEPPLATHFDLYPGRNSSTVPGGGVGTNNATCTGLINGGSPSLYMVVKMLRQKVDCSEIRSWKMK